MAQHLYTPYHPLSIDDHQAKVNNQHAIHISEVMTAFLDPRKSQKLYPIPLSLLMEKTHL